MKRPYPIKMKKNPASTTITNTSILLSGSYHFNNVAYMNSFIYITKQLHLYNNLTMYKVWLCPMAIQFHDA